METVDVRSVCRECALDLNAKWPEGHVATCWNGKCGICEIERGVCCVTDWEWSRDWSIFLGVSSGAREY